MTLARLRADAIRRAFPPPATLKRALTRVDFVQADPIRSPARAQDLILRHRVKEYRAGDLERSYPDLEIEEDFFYAYGFMTRPIWRLLHPRALDELSPFDQQVLALVVRKGEVHPRELEAELGRERAENPWGGFSKATTRSLYRLHFGGLLRIARRDRGVRVYEVAPPASDPVAADERLRRLVLLMCRNLAPMPSRSLWEAMRLLRYSRCDFEIRRSVVPELIASGELETADVEGVAYVWPAGRIIASEAPPQVRLLAPFDPLVWDRRRFELFWGWSYRFEAYTPEKKRVRGYYAMPMLWRDRMVGWANARVKQNELHVRVGFQAGRPKDAGFRSALSEEAERMRVFLGAKKTVLVRLDST